MKKFATAAVIAVTLAGTTAATVQPASAWCRFGRCGGWRGGYGWGPGALAAGLVAGAVVGTAAAVAGGPRGYGYGYGPRGGYYACPRATIGVRAAAPCFAN